jgi:thiosulfate/3-mercaptopyruvate sulfurtransferase
VTARAGAPPLVSTAWVAAHAAAPDVVVLDVGEDAADYYRGHVPGARPVAWLDDLHHRVRRGPADAPALEALLSRLGVSTHDHVVLYGGGHNAYASHAYWLLRYHRHRRLSLMDGGRSAWEQEGRPLDSEQVDPAPGHYRAGPADPTVRAGREDILSRFVGGSPGTALIDCRTPAEYDGLAPRGVDLPVDRHRVPGHMPGAHNVDAVTVLDPRTHRFLPAPTLRGIFAASGVSPAVEVATYCRLAERSSLLWFALHELLGYRHVRNYDGGWTEYGSLLDVPVVRSGLPRGAG